MAVCVPKGYLMAGVHCRIKRDPHKQDLALVMSETPAVAAGVYTRNLVCAAPVTLDRSRTPGDRIRAVAICSGVANACTGEQGLRDAEEMARLAAAACGAEADQALVLSTGVIGVLMPMDKVAQGISAAAVKLGRSETSLVAAARGMLTTDTIHKLAGRTVTIAGREIQITGMAKGAAMMGPNMATMLGLILTDAALTPERAQNALGAATEESFNCMSVDGHTSTNDTALLLANGAAGGEPLEGDDLAAFQTALDEVCVDLAKAIAGDGEGATHLITIEVGGCADRQSALQIAKTVANSPLVKTALHGADPNWGRIVSAAGYAGVPFNPNGVTLRLNGFLLYKKGSPVEFDGQAVSASIRDNRDTLIQLDFSEGTAGRRFWTADLTAEYVRLNADYHT
ncbi:MAG: bifunctional glutamate N-acetyltransferase/amino-acid acetyltransferase ArgJ [Planctomycetes bacterium]|nr:bifunctional glutamate N-acetyltransferase/amino-acid acetyltransferase ArgJ [Planctomycetota bacterium]MBU4400324.1 bifunctional glutamate N-acetyltransferase/amino-acid acetyltransferase ArgJ [Planctomycetota bacterium]